MRSLHPASLPGPVMWALAVGALTLVDTGARAQSAASQIDSDLVDVSIAQLHDYYESGKYTAVAVTRWHLDRIAKYNPTYNAFVKVFRDEALSRAARLDAESRASNPRGPLWGVPVVVKASISISGEVTTAGWWGYTRPGMELRAKANASAVDRLLDAGAIILGHTNMPDLAKGDTSVSSVAGRTANAYGLEFSPGGSSGGSATAVAASFAVTALGTDGGNSIRNPASNLSLVGVLPTHGLVSIAGVHAGDWLRERTGPMTRTVSDAARMLDVLSGIDPKDPKTRESEGHRPKTYTTYLKKGALRGKRFGVPDFIFNGTPTVRANAKYWNYATSPPTRAAFLRALDELRAAGASIVIDTGILPESFAALAAKINASRYHRQGVSAFLAAYGPGIYRSTEEFETKVGVNYPVDSIGGPDSGHILETDPEAEAQYFAPLREALTVYRETLKRFNLDGYVYPALQVPPTFEARPLPADFPSDGPYSGTGWVNRLGVPAIVVPAGFYGTGLPYGIELSADRWSDGSLLSYAYDFEQRTHHRKPPQLRVSPK